MTDADAADIFEQFHKDGLPDRVKDYVDAKKVLVKRFEKKGEKGPKLYRRTIAAKWSFPRRFSKARAIEKRILTEEQYESCKVKGQQITVSYVGPVDE